jgi:hypothetical protein
MMIKKKSTLFGLLMGAAALAAIPSAAQAAPYISPTPLNVDSAGTQVGSCVPEQDPPNGSEPPADFPLTSNSLPLVLQQPGYVIVAEEAAGVPSPATPQLCTAANIVTQLTAVVQTGGEASSTAIPGSAHTGYPMIDIGCSDVVMVTTAGTAPHVVLLNDYSSTADIKTLITGFSIPTATLMGPVVEPANGDTREIDYRFTFNVTENGANKSVGLLLQDFKDGQSGASVGCAGMTVSDGMWVGAPAIPPGAAFGLLGFVIAAGGITLARRRSARSMAN